MAGPSILTKWVADTSAMTGEVDKATTGMGGKIKDFAKGAAVALGGAFAVDKVIGFAKESIDAASNLNESISKVGIIGKSSDQILSWSQDAATSMGMSQQAALEAAGTYGNLAVSLGLPQDKAATMSTSLVGLAADMASFNNVPVDEALQALQSGLTGETQPLKKFGVNLNEAALKQQAMAMGLSDGKGPLDASAKAQAAYALMMQQSTTAQGDFTRTSDGLANKTKISAAQFEDMKAKIGEALLPAMTAITSFIGDSFLPALEAIGSWIADHKEIMVTTFIGLPTVVGAFARPGVHRLGRRRRGRRARDARRRRPVHHHRRRDHRARLPDHPQLGHDRRRHEGRVGCRRVRREVRVGLDQEQLADPAGRHHRPDRHGRRHHRHALGHREGRGRLLYGSGSNGSGTASPTPSARPCPPSAATYPRWSATCGSRWPRQRRSSTGLGQVPSAG